MYSVFDLNEQCTKINDVIFCTLNITNTNVSKRRERGGRGRKFLAKSSIFINIQIAWFCIIPLVFENWD